MSNRRIGLAKQIAFTLAMRDMAEAMTLGDLADALGLRTGTAIGERLREARVYYGFDIRHIEFGSGLKKEHRYFCPQAERERIQQLPDYLRWRTERSAA